MGLKGFVFIGLAFVIALLLPTGIISAQPPAAEKWMQRYNGPGNLGYYTPAIQAGGSGNSYIAGGGVDNLDTGKAYAIVGYRSYSEDFESGWGYEGDFGWWVKATRGPNGSTTRVSSPAYPVHSGSYSVRQYASGPGNSASIVVCCHPGAPEYAIECWIYVKQRTDLFASSLIGFVFAGGHLGWNPFADDGSYAYPIGAAYSYYKSVGLPKNSWHHVKVTYYATDATFSIWVDGSILHDHITSNAMPGESPLYYAVHGGAECYAGNVIEQYVDEVTITTGIPDSCPSWRRNIETGDILLLRERSTLACLYEFTHAGIYIGCNRVVEARSEEDGGIDYYPLTDWDYQNAVWVTLLRVKSASMQQKAGAVKFANEQAARGRRGEVEYDRYLGKCVDPDAAHWYCTELVWAAYRSQGIDIEKVGSVGPSCERFVDPVTPDNIFCDDTSYDDDIQKIDCHLEGPRPPCEVGFIVIANSPVYLVVTDPDNLTTSIQSFQIPGSIYVVEDVDGDGELEDVIYISQRKVGNYIINVIPKPDAMPTQTYSLEVSINGESTVLAQNVQISNIPSQGYTVVADAQGDVRTSPPLPIPPAPPAPRVLPSRQPAMMVVRNLRIQPGQVSAGQAVTVSANMCNDGDMAGGYSAVLRINGQVVETKMGSVGGHSAVPVNFTITKAQPGNYTVDVSGQKGSFTVIGAGGSAGSNSQDGLVAILVVGMLVLVSIIVLMITFRRPA
jgi:hypothetical protein